MSKKARQFRPKKTGAKKFVNKNKVRNASAMGYDALWQKYRFRFLHHNPLCYCCGQKATIVDHVETHKGDETKFKKLDNHMPLCKYDHDVITARFDRNMEQDIEGKLKYIQQRREETNTTVRIKVLPNYGVSKK